jgi:hypothetical protein
MSAPDPLAAVTRLRRCMRALEHARGSRPVSRQAALYGLAPLATAARQAEAEEAYRASVAAWRAEHEASLRRAQERAVRTLVALLAEALRDDREAAR